MFLSRLRKPIDAFAPPLGLLYRRLREVVRSVPRETNYGFTLTGDTTMTKRGWELHETNAYLELLETHGAVLDIGANIGFYSCLAASRGTHVLSFEPSPRNLRFLYRNLWENHFRNVEVFPLGLAKEPGLNRLYGFGGIASFVPDWAQAKKSRFAIVPVTSLDTIVGGRFQGQRLLIKMDVEGFELDVLAGAEKILHLTPKPTWLIEVLLRGGVIPGGINSRFAEVFELFWQCGYQCEALNAKRESIRPADVRRWIASGTVDAETGNFLFFEP